MTLFPSATAAAPTDPLAPPGSQLTQSTLFPAPAPTPTPAPAADNGPSIFGWHPEMPNIGGFKALGQLASGIMAIPEIVTHPQMWGPALGGVASGVIGAGLSAVGVPAIVNPIENAVQSVTGTKPQDFWQMAKHNGALYGAINTVLNALPVTGPEAGITEGAATVAEAAAKSAVVGDAATAAAAVGQGMEGADAAGFAADAAKAATSRAEILAEKGILPHPFLGIGAQSVMGDLAQQTGEDAAQYTERIRQMAESLRAKADLAHAIAHPFSAVFHGFPELARASFEKVNAGVPGEAVPPEPTALDLANATAPTAPSANEILTMENIDNMTQAQADAVRSGARALQAPEKAAAEVMDGERYKIPHTLEEPNITPDEKAATRATLKGAVDEARANVDVQGTGDGTRVAAIEAKIMEPAAAWATRLAEKLPDSVNQVLAQWSGSIDKLRIHAVARSLSSWVEVQQRMIQQSDPVQTSIKAGQALIDNAQIGGAKISVFKASQMVGEELAARMRGTSWLSELIRTDGDPSLWEAMKKAARGGYEGIPKEVWQQLSPEVAAQLEQHLSDAQALWQDAMRQRMQLLLASRPGAQGLEAAILGLDQPMMGASDLQMYRKVMQNLRMQKYLEARIEAGYRDPRFMDLRALNFDANKAAEEADVLRGNVDIAQRAAENLRVADPNVLKQANMDKVVAALRAALDDPTEGGLTIDPGTGEIGVGTDTVVVVGVAQQGPHLNVEEVKGRAEEIIRNAVEHPVKADGSAYPAGIWGSKVKLGFWIGADEKVAIDISLTHNFDGTPLSVLQGDAIATGFRQEATYVVGEGDRFLPQDPGTQDLWMHYVEDVMNPKSGLYKILDNLTGTVAGSEFINSEDAFLALQAYARWDYSLAQSNPAEMKVGDYFDVARIDYGQLAKGNLKYISDEAQMLGQTVLRLLPGSEVAAIESMNPQRLATALAWYYDSHDYIEGKYRYNADGTPKMITLLNGEQRSAAEVFYDLLAVTSVQASPTQNFGRALMGLANMDEFLSSRGDAALVAQDLMDKLEATQPELTEMVKPGTPEEHVAGPGEKGTKLSDRFLTPEVRAMTEQTQMTNAPKYKVMDVLMGNLKLDSATAGDIAHNAEWWGVDKPGMSAATMDRQAVVRELDRQGVTGPTADAYKAWTVEQQRVNDIFRQVEDANKKGIEGRMTPGQTWAQHPEWKSEWKSYAAFKTYRAGVLADEQAFLEDPQIAAAHDQALMEHQGSSLLAKLRSFRSNLSAPDTSLAVTLDSVMGRMWGFNSQQWDKVAFYSHYADQIRNIADELSAKWGYKVMPHQVQAALWVYAKEEIGRQDWGRLLAHHDIALDRVDSWERGAPVRPEDRNLLIDYQNEEIGYSNEALKTRGERSFFGKAESTGYPLTPEQEIEKAQMTQDWAQYKALNKQVSAGTLSPQDPGWAEYTALREKVGEGRTSTVWTTAPRANISDRSAAFLEEEVRHEIPYDANKLKSQLTRFHGGLDEATGERTGGWDAVNEQIQAAIDNKDWTEVRRLTTEWVVGQQRSILGSATGASFGVTAEGQLIKGELGIADENSTFLAAQRLGEAKTAGVTPNDMSTSRFRIQALEDLRAQGQITQEQFDTLAEKWKLSLDRGEPGLAQYAPAQPGFTRLYRGSDYEEVSPEAGPLPTQGTWWTDHEPYGRGGYEHWQQTDLPTTEVNRLKAQVVQDAERDRLAGGEGGQPVVGKDLILDPNNPLHARALDRAEAYAHDGVDHGTLADLHQRFFDELRGSLLDHPTMDGHLIMRMFKGAALDTLLHEGAHLLRRILPPDMLAQLAEAYPHILDEDVAAGFGVSGANPLRVAAEEKFVADLMSWIRSKTHFAMDEATGDITNATPGILGGLFGRTSLVEAAFGKIAAALEDNVASRVGGPVGSQAFDINAWWTRLFYPEINKPDVVFDPVAAGIPQMKGVETMKFPYESEPQFARRARLYGRAQLDYQNASKLADTAERRAVQADSAMKKMFVLISTEPSELERQAAAYGDKADALLTQLAAKLDNPDINKVPMQWRPLWAAIQDMKEMAAADRTGRLAEIMQDVPQTFQAMLKEAAKRGFNPTFLPDMTWEMAQRNLFGHITLGVDRVALDSTRKINQNVLNRAGIANQSIEALGAGLVAATKELYSNTLIDHIEQFYTRTIQPGAAIPEGWVPWNAERTYIVTGTRPTGEIMQSGAANLIVPQHVADALDSMSQTYDHWTFHTLTKANSVWRTWQLTLSPRYYIHIFVANMIRAAAYGVTPRDFVETVRSWRAGTLPEELAGLDMQTAYHTLTHENYNDRTMASVFQAPGYEEAQAAADTTKEHVQAAIDSAKQSIDRGHRVLDQFSRALVFEKDLREGLSRDEALGHSLDVMGDYGDLSPIERSIVRSIMPFYPYYKGLLKLLARFPADHPGATVVLMQAGKIHQEYMEDLLHGAVPSSMSTDFNIGPFGLRNWSILDPFQTAVNAAEPRNLASSLSPFVNILLSTAYNASTKGATTQGMGPTGKVGPQYDPLKGLLQIGTSIPPVAAVQGILGNKSGTGAASPGLTAAIEKYAGVPQPVNAAATQAKLYPTATQKAATKSAGVAKRKARAKLVGTRSHHKGTGLFAAAAKPKTGKAVRKSRATGVVRAPKAQRIAAFKARRSAAAQTRSVALRAPRASGGTSVRAPRAVQAPRTSIGAAPNLRVPAIPTPHIPAVRAPKQPKHARIAAFRLRQQAQGKRSPRVGSAP